MGYKRVNISEYCNSSQWSSKFEWILVFVCFSEELLGLTYDVPQWYSLTPNLAISVPTGTPSYNAISRYSAGSVT